MTTIFTIACIAGLIYAFRVFWKDSEGTVPAALIGLFSLIGLVGIAIFSSKLLLGLVLLALVGWGLVKVCSALFRGIGGNVGGKKTLKGVMVLFALIVALPPFWPITLPVLASLFVLWLLSAPIVLLFGSIKDFMKD